MAAPPPSPVPPEVVDLERVAAWMDERTLGRGPITDVALIAGGTQNVLLRFRRDDREYVLRRPPPHKRANSDETMRREARVLAALAGTDVPHPALIAACADTDVIGAAFTLMEPVDGFNPSTGLPDAYRDRPDWQRRMGLAMADGIAALARVDHVARGLADFGKAEGWLERQVPRWRAQLASYSELDGYDGPDIPGVDDVARWLDAHRPGTWQPGLIHGDCHFANVIFRYDAPELSAIVDWELATIGDPLLDLGHLLATWPEPGSPAAAATVDAPALPTRAEVIDQYARGTTRPLHDLAWFQVLACYRLGIILEGTYARAAAGKAPRDVGEVLHAITLGLFAQAVGLIEG
ncbi:MAG TPA: phosphotransferase family protein [Acidimicrobiia bacterium]|nr:phosphotransferase family protein [Acidimicrobiia bacterium]